MEDEFFDLFRRIRREVDRMFREMEEMFIYPMFDLRSRSLEPLVDVREEVDEIVVTVDLPYVRSKEDIDVRFSGGQLIIEARMCRHVRYPVMGGCRDAEFNRFRTSIPLPNDVEIEGAKAVFRRGILEVRIPRRVRRFRVKVE